MRRSRFALTLFLGTFGLAFHAAGPLDVRTRAADVAQAPESCPQKQCTGQKSSRKAKQAAPSPERFDQADAYDWWNDSCNPSSTPRPPHAAFDGCFDGAATEYLPEELDDCEPIDEYEYGFRCNDRRYECEDYGYDDYGYEDCHVYHAASSKASVGNMVPILDKASNSHDALRINVEQHGLPAPPVSLPQELSDTENGYEDCDEAPLDDYDFECQYGKGYRWRYEYGYALPDASAADESAAIEEDVDLYPNDLPVGESPNDRHEQFYGNDSNEYGDEDYGYQDEYSNLDQAVHADDLPVGEDPQPAESPSTYLYEDHYEGDEFYSTPYHPGDLPVGESPTPSVSEVPDYQYLDGEYNYEPDYSYEAEANAAQTYHADDLPLPEAIHADDLPVGETPPVDDLPVGETLPVAELPGADSSSSGSSVSPCPYEAYDLDYSCPETTLPQATGPESLDGEQDCHRWKAPEGWYDEESTYDYQAGNDADYGYASPVDDNSQVADCRTLLKSASWALSGLGESLIEVARVLDRLAGGEAVVDNQDYAPAPSSDFWSPLGDDLGDEELGL